MCKAAYLESLEPYILNDQLRGLPPTIVKEFVSHYEELGNFKVLNFLNENDFFVESNYMLDFCVEFV